MPMTAPNPTAKDFITLFDKLLNFFGDEAFGIIECALLYSSTSADILKELFGKTKACLKRAEKKSNKGVAPKTAKRIHAATIEDTRMGRMLDAAAIYAFFKAAYPLDPAKGVEEADKAWKYLSRKFIQSLSGDIVTVVCGADKGRVFFQDELPEIVRNTKIKTINGVPWAKIRDLYFSDPKNGPYKAFQYICLSELRLASQRAHTEKTKEAIEEYFYKRAFYRAERRMTLTASGKAVPAVYRKKTKAEHKRELADMIAKITGTPAPARPAKKAAKPRASKPKTP